MSDAAHEDGVSIQFAAFAPRRIDVVAGDTVRWTNNSVRVHTVNAVDGSWSSPRIVGTDSFSHEFDTPGATPYYCVLHPFMRGEVDVHNVLLAAPTEPGAPGRPYALRGRSALPPGTERRDRGGHRRRFQARRHGHRGRTTARSRPT